MRWRTKRRPNLRAGMSVIVRFYNSKDRRFYGPTYRATLTTIYDSKSGAPRGEGGKIDRPYLITLDDGREFALARKEILDWR